MQANVWRTGMLMDSARFEQEVWPHVYFSLTDNFPDVGELRHMMQARSSAVADRLRLAASAPAPADGETENEKQEEQEQGDGIATPVLGGGLKLRDWEAFADQL